MGNQKTLKNKKKRLFYRNSLVELFKFAFIVIESFER